MILECDGDAPQRRVRLATSAGASRTRIDFGDETLELEQVAQVVSVGLRPRPGWNLDLSLGSILAGSLAVADGDRSFGPGFALAVAGSWLALAEDDGRPFVLVGLSLGHARTQVAGDTLAATDLRLSVVSGKTFGPVTTYAVARAFGGPVAYRLSGEDVIGTDVYHYALGAGATVRWTSAGLDAFAEVVPLGEKSVTLGIGYSF